MTLPHFPPGNNCVIATSLSHCNCFVVVVYTRTVTHVKNSQSEPVCVGVRACACVWAFLFAGRVFNGSGKPIDKGPTVMAEEYLDIMGTRLEL
jgi:vacuolar-type H+-ATPase subunit B/Vma2